jgi:outer membrane protein assembly complex protein YaeT
MHATDRCLPPASPWAGALAGLLLWAAAGLAQTLPPPRPLDQAFVADVKVQGNRNTPAQRIFNTVRTRANTPYSQATVNEDIRKLSETGLFANVWVKTDPRPDGSIEVTFVVAERAGRVEDIVYQGAKHLKPDDLKTLTGIRKGEPMVPWRNQQACRLILEKYYEQGRPLATVRLLEGANDSDNRVVFDISEGPKVKVADIDFTGNTFVSKAVLQTKLKSSKKILGLLGGKFSPILADLDVTTLEEYYKSFGFHDTRVRRELRWEGDGRDVVLIFHIHEGPRYRVADRPQVEGVGRELSPELVAAMPRVKPGEFYNETDVQRDVSFIKDYYGRTGRDVRVRPDVFHPADAPGVCQVVYRVEERPPARVGDIYIVGNRVTKDNVIYRQLTEGLAPGQILSYPDIRIAERNLARLNIFEVNGETGVRPTIEVLDREGDAAYKDLLIRVEETKTGSLLFGVGVNSDAGLSGSVVLNERNFDIFRFPTSFDDFLAGRAFRGAGQELRIEAVPGTVAQRYSATFREPFLFDSPYSLTLGGYYYTRIFDEYTESRLGTRVSIGRRINDRWTASVTARVENVGVHDVPFFAPSDYTSVVGDNLVVGVRGGVTRDTRDSYLRPTEGSMLDVSFEQVFGDFTFPLVNVDFNKYWTVWQRNDGGGRHVLAMHNQFAWAGTDAPVFERFYAGGFRSMRGFQFRGISPDVNGFKVGGDFMLLNSLEYQVPVMANEHLFLVGFVDSGTVESRLDIKDYRVSAGFGVRFIVPMLGPVPIALDFGFPITRTDADREQIFSFWLGFFH